MPSELIAMGRLVVGTLRDLAPIVLVVAFFEIVVLQQHIDNLGTIALGLVFVMLGLAIFIRGLEMALFPLGETLAAALCEQGVLDLADAVFVRTWFRYDGR